MTPNNKSILIDGGGSDFSSFNVGKETLMPYLLDRKIAIVDYIMVSHFDTDHVGGLLYIMQNMKVKNAIISNQPETSQNFQEFIKIAKEKKINIIVVNAGDKLNIEKDLYFNILWPDKNDFISENTLNNNSIVCNLNYKRFSCVFTGDIEEIAEKKILEKNKLNLLKADILKVAHHGSKTSSKQELINTVQPKIALIGVGRNNNFGHPNEQIINRLQDNGVKVFRTDQNGEISIVVDRRGEIVNIQKFIK